MDTFYPFTDPQLVRENVNQIPDIKEYAYDLDTGQFKHKDGKMYLVHENEALEIKIWKLFMSERYKWVVFPWEYGHELETLIGKAYTQGYVNSEAERYIRESIRKALGRYINRLDDFKITFNDGTLKVDFKVVSIYGSFNITDLRIIR